MFIVLFPSALDEQVAFHNHQHDGEYKICKAEIHHHGDQVDVHDPQQKIEPEVDPYRDEHIPAFLIEIRDQQ